MTLTRLIDEAIDDSRGVFDSPLRPALSYVFDICAVLQEAIDRAAAEHPGRQIIANCTVSRVVRCDPQMLRLTATHLLVNALAYGSGTGAIGFIAAIEGDELIMEVWNDGEPIPAALLPLVHKKFWRGPNTASQAGLGLGLHHCAQIVDAHGGSVRVKSSPALGTRFVVRLPVSEAAQMHDADGTGPPN